MMLSEVAHIVQGHIVKGNGHGSDARCAAVVTDSRAVEHGDLFIAIVGEKFDGHDFVAQAAEKGALGAMVSTVMGVQLGQIKVADTTQAMGQLASHWRSRFDIPVLAVTGSNGKTTVTAMAASILNQCGHCLHPKGSFNNQWGVPLTLLKLNERHDFAVIEMGANHLGEIANLSRITQPTIALINNVAAAHLEGLDNQPQIARAKAEIFCGLNECGTAIINADDPFSGQWFSFLKTQLKKARVISFSMEKPADLGITNLQSAWLDSRFTLHIARQHIDIHLALAGKHNVMNALAAAAICYAAGATIQTIKIGLEKMQAVAGRLNLKAGLVGCQVIDDSYNANPQSVKAAIDVLVNFDGHKILVLGVMDELGVASAQLHREVGQYAYQKGIDTLYCLGQDNHAREYVQGYGQGSRMFATADDLVVELKGNLSADVAVLVKGSRSSMMERVVDAIIAEERMDGADETRKEAINRRANASAGGLRC